MDARANTDRNQNTEPEQSPEPADLVPAAGKSAARPSEAEHIQSLHEDQQKGGAPERPDDHREGSLSGIA